MRVEEFKNKHSGYISSWLIARDLNVDLTRDLPAIGFISFDDNDHGVAAGFLRQVEGDFLFIDSLITNPVMAPEIRNIALDMVVVELIEQAKKMNVRMIYAHCTDGNTIERGKKYEFVEQPYKVMALNFKRGN